MENLYKAPAKDDNERFNKEIIFFAYIAHKAAELKDIKEYSITRLTKIAANYVQDWEITGGNNYRPFLGIKPNPYGMVAAIPQPIAGRPLFIYELQSLAKRKRLWDSKKDGDNEQVIMLSDSDSLHERLLKIDTETKFNLGFNVYQLKVASFLSEIYSELSTRQLNILASHRNINKSKDCLKYAFRVWETNYGEVFQNIKSPVAALEYDVKDKILKMAISCEQIELKTSYIFHRIQEVTTDLEKLASKFDGLERAIVEAMVDKIRNESQIDNSASFNEQYLLNREYMYPITEAMINVFNRSFQGDPISEKQKPIRYMKKAFQDPSIIDTNISPVEVSCSGETKQILENIDNIHNLAVKRGRDLLIKFLNSPVHSSPGKLRDEIFNWVDKGDD